MHKSTFSAAGAITMAAAILFCSCNSQSGSQAGSPDTPAPAATAPAPANTHTIRDKPLSAAEQQALSPDSVLQRLKDGNKRFAASDLTARDHSALVRSSVSGQYPEAVVLTCMDSRIPVEDVFDRAIGDIFVIRVAGNISNADNLGSLEYGCKVAGAKLIVVMGHEACGAVKAAIDDEKLGNITELLSRVKPAIVMSQKYSGDKSSKDDGYVEFVAKNNVANVIAEIKAKSPVLKAMLDKGEIRIVGAYYSLKTGEVTFL